MHATTTTSLMRSTAAVGFLSLLQPMLHGCTAGPKAPPETAPPAADALLGTQSASVDASRQPAPRWWEDLHDATLDALIARAEAGNQTLAAAVANVRAAYAGVGASEAQLWPAVGVGAQYSRTLTNIAQLAAAGVRVEPYDMYAYGVGMQSWEIDLWGGVRRQIEAAEADAASKVDALRDALVSVRTQVAAVYVQVRTLQAQRAVLVANRDALAKSRDLVKARYDAGTTNLLDVSRAQAALDGVEAQVPQVDAGLASAVSQLAVLCGANPSEIAPLVAAVAPLPESPDVAGIGLPAEILERRPDVRAAKERLTAATAAIGVAEAARLPTVYVSGQFYIASNTVSGLGDLANKAYSIGPSLYLPLLDGGRIDSAVRQQRALGGGARAVPPGDGHGDRRRERGGGRLRARPRVAPPRRRCDGEREVGAGAGQPAVRRGRHRFLDAARRAALGARRGELRGRGARGTGAGLRVAAARARCGMVRRRAARRAG